MTRELWIMEVERNAEGRVVGVPVAVGKATGAVVDDVLALLTVAGHDPVTLAREEEPWTGAPGDPTAGTCPSCSEVVHDWDCPRVGDGRPAEPRP